MHFMQELNFPAFSFRIKNKENKPAIFDEIRKKFVILQPEEWVRQHCIKYLLNHKNIPASLLNVEKELIFNTLKKRYDIVTFNPDGSLYLIVECKAPTIAISQETFNQIAVYNMALSAQYLMVTNGINHYYCQMDFVNKRYIFLKDLPNYSI